MNAIFITVRTQSTRLPAKALKPINGMPTIEYLIKRMKHSRNADAIILCTTENESDDVLIEIAKRQNIKYFRGSEKDKLMRWNGAVQKYGIDYFVTADGDDVLCDPKLVDMALEQMKNTEVDFIQATDIICGAFTYCIRGTALQKVCEIKDSDDTEMMWVYFTETGLFRIAELQNVPNEYYRDDIRMTLDYPEDFQFFRTIIEHYSNRELISLSDVVRLVDKRPEIKNINYFRQEQFLNNQANKTSLKLKVAE